MAKQWQPRFRTPGRNKVSEDVKIKLPLRGTILLVQLIATVLTAAGVGYMGPRDYLEPYVTSQSGPRPAINSVDGDQGQLTIDRRRLSVVNNGDGRLRYVDMEANLKVTNQPMSSWLVPARAAPAFAILGLLLALGLVGMVAARIMEWQKVVMAILQSFTLTLTLADLIHNHPEILASCLPRRSSAPEAPPPQRTPPQDAAIEARPPLTIEVDRRIEPRKSSNRSHRSSKSSTGDSDQLPKSMSVSAKADKRELETNRAAQKVEVSPEPDSLVVEPLIGGERKPSKEEQV